MAEPDPAPDAIEDEPEQVGVAHMLDDGTLELELRATAPDGSIGEALMVVPPDHPKHAAFCRHLGGIEPGQSCAIPPFDGSEL